MRGRPPRLTQRPEQGFGLLIFVVIVLAVAVALVTGYWSTLAYQQKNAQLVQQQAYLAQAQRSLQAYYQQNAYVLDQSGLGNVTTIGGLLAAAGVQRQYGMQAALSQVLASPEGLSYRVVVLYLPSDTDSANPPGLTTFGTTGAFTSCSTSGPCAPRAYVVFSSLGIERTLDKATDDLLSTVAAKAQVYFSDRQRAEDPERNVYNNYFLTPYLACDATPEDLDCLPNFTNLSGTDGNGNLVLTRTAVNLGLSPFETVSAWGQPIQATNENGVSPSPPYTMLFRAETPAGTYLTKTAVEQL